MSWQPRRSSHRDDDDRGWSCSEAVKSAFGGSAPRLEFVLQEPQLGTAHALLTAEPVLKAPLEPHPALRRCALCSQPTHSSVWWIDMRLRRARRDGASPLLVANPHGYGRIVRSGDAIARIVEENDASPASARFARSIRDLCLCSRGAVRRRSEHRLQQHPTASITCRILLPSTPAGTQRSRPSRFRRRRNPRHQQPRRSGRSESAS